MESGQDKSWKEFLAKIETFSHRDIVERAVNFLPENTRCVVDCGCGDGRNSQYLLNQNLEVHAFDQDVSAVNLCRMRFLKYPSFAVCLSSHEQYIYPANSLVLAFDNFLVSSPENFALCWHNLSCSIEMNGLFCGDFLGVKDSWSNQYNQDAMKFSEADIRTLLSAFDILEWQVKDTSVTTMSSQEKHKHTHTLLARKRY